MTVTVQAWVRKVAAAVGTIGRPSTVIPVIVAATMVLSAPPGREVLAHVTSEAITQTASQSDWRDLAAAIFATSCIALVIVATVIIRSEQRVQKRLIELQHAKRDAERAEAAACREMKFAQASNDRRLRVQHRLAYAERMANLGHWRWNVQTGRCVWSDQLYQIIGRSPSDTASYAMLLDHVHGQDRAAVAAAVQHAIESGEPYAFDHRLVRTDGVVLTVHARGELSRDATGRPHRFTGILQDVTAIRRAEDARRHSESRLAAILSIAPEAIIAVDLAGIVQLFNTGAERIFGYTADEMLGKSMDILLPERARAAHRRMMVAFGETPEKSRLMAGRSPISGRRRDGTEFPAEASIAKIDVDSEQLFTVILRDISDRVEAERLLVAAKEEAEFASRAKSDFLANMSHELRTPLNAIIGFSEMMRTHQFGAIGESHYEEYAVSIHDSGRHLLRIINDILDVAKIEAGKMSTEDGPTDLGGVIRDTARLMQGPAHERGVTLSLDVRSDMPLVIVDEMKLKRVVLNLLSNAVKFTEPEGQVTTSLSLDANASPVLTVADSGIGIPADRLPHICQPFVQVESGLNRRFDGTGLGLALSRVLVELHGGTLTIESEVGRGTTVSVRLPPERVCWDLPQSKSA